MYDWKQSSNGSDVRPPELEVNVDTVYLRKGYELVEATEYFPKHWKYMEMTMAKDFYPVFKFLNDTIAEQDELLAMLLLSKEESE